MSFFVLEVFFALRCIRNNQEVTTWTGVKSNLIFLQCFRMICFAFMLHTRGLALSEEIVG